MMALRIFLILLLFAMPALGQGENVWNVYCNGDYSECAVAKEPSGELIYAEFSSPVTWDEAWTWMEDNGYPAQPGEWNVYCNGDRSKCSVAKEPSGEYTFAVFSTPVTWDDAWAWMSASGFPAQPAVWNVYCNGDRSKCAVAKEPSGEFMFAVFSTPVTWDEAWAWMKANGYSAVGPGDVLNECETSTSTICGKFTREGNSFKAEWANGAKATLSIERFDSTVILNRYDQEGASTGLSARYVGERTGNRIEGDVTWTWNEQSWKGTWTAEGAV